MQRQLGRLWVFVLGLLCGLAVATLWRRTTRNAKAWEVPSVKVKLKYENPEPSSRLWGVLPAPRVLSKQLRKHLEALCDDVFMKVDHDDSGRLDSAELHIAVLMVYGQVNHLMKLSLKPPDAEEVKAMLAEADVNSDGQLSRSEFKKIFMSRFFHRIFALAAARLLTQRLVVPASALALHTLAERQGLEAAVEGVAARLGGTLAGGLAPRERRAAEQLAVATTMRLSPVASLHLAGASAQILHVEPLIARILGSRAARRAAKNPSS